jgi:peptidyl-prolyl cis-trans isomerase A (cyclophilin A)
MKTLMTLCCCAFAACALAACEGCDSEDVRTEPLAESTGPLPEKVVTDDGYEVILASTEQRQRRRAEEERRARARENLILEPNQPDPEAGEFTLEEAVEDLPLDGDLVAEIRTPLGTILCDLFADRAPNTVANFVGLARGKRPFWDPSAGEWVERPFYRDLPIFRVVPGYLIQTGDPLADGSGRVGYTIPDEIHETLRSHDRAGQLCMASYERNQNGAQWFITDGPSPDLDGGYPIFGQCIQTDIVERIARVPQGGENRPITDVLVERLLIRRVPGGAESAEPTPPQREPGTDPEHPEGTGASPGPSELNLENQIEERRRQMEEARRQGLVPPETAMMESATMMQ